MKPVTCILLLTVCIFLSGCGVYGFRGSNPPEGIRTLYLPIAIDNSGFAEANFKENFTETLKNKIISDATFRLADNATADGQLTLNIISVTDDPLVISGNETVSKRKITIAVNVDLQNLRTQRSVIERRFENWGEYSASTNSFTDRERGVREAINRLSDDILNDLTSNW